MTSRELENLAAIGKLKRERASDEEIAGLTSAAEERLADASRADLSYASRFDLAYNAAHGLALAALRRAGYRSNNRYLVFQALPHTVGMAAEKGAFWRRRTSGATSRNMKGMSNTTTSCWPS